MDFLDPELERELDEMVTQLESPPPKSCKTCGESNPDKLVSFKRKKKTYLARKCKTCKVQEEKIRALRNPERTKGYVKKKNLKLSLQRRGNTCPEKFILEDCRGSDGKKGLENDLTLEFIRLKISKGCQYCKTLQGRISLDRIDNSKGHLKDNVVPSCLRCNYTRGGMPYIAWLEISPAMRLANSKSLFTGWRYMHFDFSK